MGYSALDRRMKEYSLGRGYYTVRSIIPPEV
jgi:hypothetical protein